MAWSYVVGVQRVAVFSLPRVISEAGFQKIWVSPSLSLCHDDGLIPPEQLCSSDTSHVPGPATKSRFLRLRQAERAPLPPLPRRNIHPCSPPRPTYFPATATPADPNPTHIVLAAIRSVSFQQQRNTGQDPPRTTHGRVCFPLSQIIVTGLASHTRHKSFLPISISPLSLPSHGLLGLLRCLLC